MIAVLIIIAALFCLYWFGLLPVSTKRATSFVGSGGWGSQSVGASYTSCHGRIHRVLRFRETRSYSFHLTGHFRQGSVTVRIQDRGGAQLLELNAENPSGIIAAEKGKQYFLNVIFQNASGDYQLEWS